MRSATAVELIVCGLFVAGLCGLAPCLHPHFPHTTGLAGLAGGGACVLCGAFARRSPCSRAAAMVILAAMSCVFVLQLMRSWEAAVNDVPQARMLVAFLAVLLVFCLSMLVVLAREKSGCGS